MKIVNKVAIQIIKLQVSSILLKRDTIVEENAISGGVPMRFKSLSFAHLFNVKRCMVLKAH